VDSWDLVSASVFGKRNLVITTALTPALSPRRGSAPGASTLTQDFFLVLGRSNDLKFQASPMRPTVLPLLGERGGVRASVHLKQSSANSTSGASLCNSKDS
jgi:hypothetical protein